MRAQNLNQAATPGCARMTGPDHSIHEPAMKDQFLASADAALRTLFAAPRASRPCPTLEQDSVELTPEEAAHAAGLMRVNDVGEICAQALYAGQALATRNPALRAQFQRAADEEADHLAWTRQRLNQLGARPSIFNPLWYFGAFGLGMLASRLGDRVSLGFVAETEDQVGAHLQSHLERLPANDQASRAIVAQMQTEELEHAANARAAGAMQLPPVVQDMMRAAAKVMTTVAYRL